MKLKVRLGTDGSTITYVYKPIRIMDSKYPGSTNKPNLKYPNDPTDPNKTQDNQQKHYHTYQDILQKDENGQPPKPVDPQDPTKGYVVPNIPTDPSQDTVITMKLTKLN